jgi:hypothetical protein
MAVLPEDSAHHRWEDRTVRERPVRNGKTGIVAGNKSAGDEQQESTRGRKHGEAMHAVI